MVHMRIAVVTGASRGVGKGIAISLAAAGYRVYATGRSITAAELPEDVVRIRCDHTKSEQNDELFRRIAEDAGTLDVLVNNAWGGYERMNDNDVFTWPAPFWEQPEYRWPSMMDAGVRAAFECSVRAARAMVEKGSGLMVNISFWAARKHLGNAIYGIAKAATDKLTADTAHELRRHGVAVVSLYPGLVRTESVMEAAKHGWLDISNSESPEYVGRVIAALADDPKTIERSGQVLIAAAVGAEYGLTDVDGRAPRPLTIEEV